MKAYQGYETWINPLRMSLKMYSQIIGLIFVIHILIVLILTYRVYSTFDNNEKTVTQKFLVNKFNKFVNKKYTRNYDQLFYEFIFLKHENKYLLSFSTYLLLPLIIYGFSKRSKHLFDTKHLRGSRLIKDKVLKKLLSKCDCRLPIAHNLFLPIDAEVRHFFFAGASGAGKTVFLTPIIKLLKDQKQKVILYDAKDGEFVAKLYDENTDYIFNPFDSRSFYFNVFDCIHEESDFDLIAKSIVPDSSSKEPFFNNAARDLLAGILKYCHVFGNRKNEDVWDLLIAPTTKVYSCLKKIKSEAATLIENVDSGQSQSVMSTLKQHAKIFKYLIKTNDQTFNLNEWFSDNKSSFIFLPNNTKQRESLKGIFSLFFNLIANEILSLRDNPDRRIFIILDEFGTLHKIESIKDLLTLGRSKGASCFLGVQEKSQIDHIYSKDMSATLINQCSNKAIFRLNEAESSDYFSRLMGENETEKIERSQSAGVQDNKDGESYRSVQKKERIVLPSELEQLPDLNYFLKISGNNYTKTKCNYSSLDDVSQAFIKNTYFSLDVISSDDEQSNIPDSKSSASGSYSEKKHLNQIEDFRPEIQDKKETIKSIDEPDHQELTNGGNIDGQENRFGEELDITI